MTQWTEELQTMMSADTLASWQTDKQKRIVIKYGGSIMANREAQLAAMEDIVLLSSLGIQVILVHGGGPEITAWLNRMGKEAVFHEGLRVTDAETMEIVQMVLAGKVSKELVKMINRLGGNAISLSGMDGGMMQAEERDEHLGFVGNITEIDPAVILDLLAVGYLPVIGAVGVDQEGNSYNINADTAAAEIAGALTAELLISLTDTPGILYDLHDPASLIPQIEVAEAQQLMETGVISGGMIPKVNCCTAAIQQGVKKVLILDGRIPHGILSAVARDSGIGTAVVPNGTSGNTLTEKSFNTLFVPENI